MTIIIASEPILYVVFRGFRFERFNTISESDGGYAIKEGTQ